ncbi:antibiotic resistance protein [Pontibacillus chungwhensis BH030062]|uniref:Antibiotic resistance protein n=1 Tax=Pontibacillus chungwhensis BH030062 TaxID=1385513 RepID=A0A0A2UX84_9BACI|nr:MFS transporter [Pontibacillus chungwhensis]KGP92554.1 antibiotic resistance protein [Pontibacillus chungwhensis BH030062]
MTNQPEKLWNSSFIFLILANWFTFMSFQMLIPTLPPYMEELGGSKFQVGLVTTLFSIGAILSRPFIGHLLQTQSRKRLVLLGSVSLLVITLLYSFTTAVLIFLAFRFIHGLAWGWSSTTNGTAAVDLVPKKRIGEGMGYFGLSVTIGMIIAPSLGIYLYQNFSFSVLIYTSVSLGTIAFVLFSLTKFRTPDNIKNKTLKDEPFTFWGSMIEKRSWYPAMISFFNTFGYGSIVTFIVIFGQEQGIEQIYLFYLFNAALATIMRPITGKWFDRKGPWLLIMACSVLAFAGMWTIALADNFYYIIAAGILFGAGFGSMMPAFQAWVISKTTQERSGIANGMYYSTIDLGIGLSALLLGAISNYVETATLFKISSASFVIVLILTFLDYQKNKDVEWESEQT